MGSSNIDYSYYFYVVVPNNNNESVKLYEKHSYNKDFSDKVQPIQGDDILISSISTETWEIVKPIIKNNFNTRLKKEKEKTLGLSKNGTIIEKMLGKELSTLFWALELCDYENASTVGHRWLYHMPEELWWLYSSGRNYQSNTGCISGWKTSLFYMFGGDKNAV